MSETKVKMELMRKTITSLKERIAQVRAEYVEKAKGLFQEVVVELFNQHPRLQEVSWKQYTCYFNDGDTCYFNAYTDYLDMTFDDKEYIECTDTGGYCEDGDEDYDYETDPNNEEIGSIVKFLDENIFNLVDEDDLEDLFGDHVRIVLTKEGLDVQDYHDHD